MNNKYTKDFNTALNIYNNEYSHEELIKMLETGTITEKQISILKLDCIKSPDDADLLLKHLVGQDGKIREAAAFRLEEFMQNHDYAKLLCKPVYRDIYLNAVIDINGNICRNVIKALSYYKNNNEFFTPFCKKIAENIFELIKETEKFNIQDGKYKINKQIFKLYWLLEAVYEFYEYFDINTLKSILLKTKDIHEYTIREKTAKILSINFSDNELRCIQQELKNDKNYYVRRF